MTEVVQLEAIRWDNTPVIEILEAAKNADLKEVLILAYDTDDNEYFASSTGNAMLLNWLLDKAKIHLMTPEE